MTDPGRAAGGTTFLVGGLSSLHDPLVAAALRRRGVDARPLPTPTSADMAAGRALLAHGYPGPIQLLVGAVVREARRLIGHEGRPAAGLGFLTLGGRFSGYGSDYRRAFDLAGLAGLRVAALPLTGALDGAGEGLPLDARAARQVALACVVGDLLRRAGCRARPVVERPAEVDARIAAALGDLVDRLARGSSVTGVLARLAAELGALPRRPFSGPRVRLTGDLFSSLTDGDGSCGAERALEARGAVVEPPTVSEWIALLLWQLDDDLGNGQARLVPGATLWKLRPADEIRDRLRRAGRALRATYRRLAVAAGLSPSEIPDMDRLARLAAPHYATDLRGGPGHLEVGLFLLAEEEGGADLVLSLKPFGSAPSSSLSDGVLHRLSETSRTCFASLEVSGEGRLQAESRLELALELARRRATLRR